MSKAAEMTEENESQGIRLLVLVSGGGTNLQAIIDAVEDGDIRHTKIAAVISNNPGVKALSRAEAHGIPARVISPKDFSDREAFHQALLAAVNEIAPDLIVLAGYLVNIPAAMIRAYPNRIINIHPSLIPAFSGKGYYGLKVHEGVLSRGCKVTGATVHFVDEGTDTGPIILQKAVETRPDDTPESLQRRVMEEAEWHILPRAIALFAEGRISVTAGKVRIEDEDSNKGRFN